MLGVPNPAALKRQFAYPVGSPAYMGPQPAAAAAGAGASPQLSSLYMGPPAAAAAAGAAAESPELTALINSFATIFQVSKAGVPQISTEHAQALSRDIIISILTDKTDFVGILPRIQEITIRNNAASGRKKVAIQSPAALRRANTIISLERERIGKGSYGTIYKVVDEGRPAVLKQIEVKKTAPAELRGIFTELLIQHILSQDPAFGTSVARPYNVFIDSSGPSYNIYIHMDLIPQTFSAYMASGPTTEAIKSFLIKVAQILQYFSNTYQFYHCDFHTGNIMLKDGEPIIIDFGYASLTPPGLPRIYGKYRGMEPINDLLIFVAAFISYYGNSVHESFTAKLRNQMMAQRTLDLAEVDTYSAAKLNPGRALFHKFYYFAEFGNPLIYQYPRLNYKTFAATIGGWSAPIAPIDFGSLPLNGPVSLNPANVFPWNGAPARLLNLGRSLSPIPEGQVAAPGWSSLFASVPAVVAAAAAPAPLALNPKMAAVKKVAVGQAAKEAAAASGSSIPAAQSLSGLKRRFQLNSSSAPPPPPNKGGARRTRKPKRSARKTHKRPGRK